MQNRSFTLVFSTMLISASIAGISQPAVATDVIRADVFSGQDPRNSGIDLITSEGQSVRVHGPLDVLQNKIINVPSPVDPLDAVNKAYVDNLRTQMENNKTFEDAAALAAALDSRGPVGAKKYRVSIDTAHYNSANAVGFNFVGVLNNDERTPTFDYGVGAAFTDSENMLKGSVGVSW